MAALRARDQTAFAFLYDNYAGALLGVIARIVHKEEMAEEVLQDVFLKIWDRIDSYDREKGKLFTWMVNIARNQAIDRTRSKEFTRQQQTADLGKFVNRIDAADHIEQGVEAIGLSDLLRRLPEEQQFVIEKHYLSGYTQSEISEEFNLPLGTVKTRMRLAMQVLRNLLVK